MNLISIIHVLQRGHAVKRKRFELAFQSAYQSEANNVELYGFGYRDTVHKKGRGNKLLSATNLDIKIKKI
jgi:hypothetical protein